MIYLLWSGCRMSLPTLTRVQSIPKWVWCKHQNGKIKLYVSAICISGAAAKQTLWCLPAGSNFAQLNKENDHVFSRWQKTVTWGIRPISQRPATSANWDRVPDIHPQFLRRWQLVDGKCEGLQRPIKTARNTIHLYWQLRSIHVHVQLKLKLSQIHPKSKLSTNI